MRKRNAALIVSMCLLASLTGCSSGSGPTAESAGESGSESAAQTKAESDGTKEEGSEEENAVLDGEPTVIRYGTHWINGLDPNYVDEVTGEYTMAESERQAALAALDAVKQELNVVFEFVQYSGDVQNDLMTSVLAGNPVCDLAIIWGGAEGTILAQNVLQQLDDYEDLFSDEESSWMWYDKLYGHNYLLSSSVRFKQRWPLVFNISMIEQVDSLKDEEGNTIYPMDLFLDGEWTWSTFTDYLEKIQAYYGSTQAPDGCVHDTIQAYETDYRFAGLSAMYAAGGAIYGSDGLAVDSEGSLEGVAYITDLMEKGLLTDPGVYEDQFTPSWTTASGDFSLGGTVFTDSPDWLIGGNASACSERGESIGIVPWPRPDDMELEDPAYGQVITLGDSVGVLKGVDEEKTELALKAFKLYWQTYYKALGGVDSIKDYKEQNAVTELATLGLDIYNETYGDDLVECFTYITNHLVPDYADLLGLRVPWDTILGKSLYGVDGMSSYDVAIQANMSEFTNKISDMESILQSDEVKDNRPPEFTVTNAVLPTGTNGDEVDWSQYFTVEDAVDGALDINNAEITVNGEIDFTVPGKYENAVTATMADSAGNEGEGSLSVIVYDAANTEPPVITAVEELPAIAVDTDASTITWKGTYIASAVDADGLDVSDNIEADLSQLDTTTPGTYEVVITVKDYAGNESTATLNVTVESESDE